MSSQKTGKGAFEVVGGTRPSSSSSSASSPGSRYAFITAFNRCFTAVNCALILSFDAVALWRLVSVFGCACVPLQEPFSLRQRLAKEILG
jgi:hypothetical protein